MTAHSPIKIEPHPLLWPHTPEQCADLERQLTSVSPELLAAPDANLAGLVESLSLREARIAQADLDPLKFGFEPEAWKLGRAQFRVADTVAVFGANRTTKSWMAGKMTCESAWAYPGGTIVALAENDVASVETQQSIVWHHFRSRLEKLNSQRNAKFKVNWTDSGGFTEGKLQLPNGRNGLPGTKLFFLTYNRKATDYEGWEFGAKVEQLVHREDGTLIENIGWWADESLDYEWLEVLTRRSPFRKAKGVWTFTPVRGITPAIKEFLGPAPKILEHAAAELLPKVRVPGCPTGHMPVVAEPYFKKSRAVWFHLGANPFGNYTQGVIELCEGKSQEYVECVAYGYARNTAGNAFPQFGQWNVVDDSDLPERGTNFQIVDPAEVRAWASVWVRVCHGPGGVLEFWFYRDWPDQDTHGEWAVPTKRITTEESTKGWDGDPGPAQWTRVDGISGYKRLWRDLETVRGGGDEEVDPYRRRLQRGLRPGDKTREEIEDRFIDSRAAVKPHMEELGATSTVEQFDEEHEDTEGGEPLEAIRFQMAKGDRIDLNMIRELLAAGRNADGQIVRAPRLFVARRCKQIIWALTNYTGKAKESGAAKDFVDVIRYAVGADLYHATPGALKSWRPGVDDEAED